MSGADKGSEGGARQEALAEVGGAHSRAAQRPADLVGEGGVVGRELHEGDEDQVERAGRVGRGSGLERGA